MQRRLFGGDHLFGSHPLVKLIGRQQAKGDGSLSEGRSFLVGLFRTLGGI